MTMMTMTQQINLEAPPARFDPPAHLPGMIEPVELPAFPVQGILYFLDGHYLFRYDNGQGGWTSKFVTSLDVSAAFSAKEQDTGWLPAGVVRTGANARGPWVVYSAPPQKIDLLAGSEVLTVPIPRTVMVCTAANHYLWALQTKHFDPDARAYNAPFPNVYADGHICWGQNAAPEVDPGQARKAWELFFATPFNTDLSNNKSRSHRDNVTGLLRRLAEERKRAYPVDDLMPVGDSIGSLVARAIERGS